MGVESENGNLYDVTLTLGLTVILLSCLKLVWRYTYFVRRGIPGPIPVPILGNAVECARKGIHLAFDDYIKAYGDGCGYFQFMTPSILLSDPETIKLIAIKYFDRFQNRQYFPVDNPHISKALFLSRDEEWRKIRHTLTPAFSGMKMRLMSKLIKQPADTLMENFDEVLRNGKNGIFECRDVYGTYIMDTIALCAFGLKVNSQKNKNDPFVSNAKRFFSSINFTSPSFIISTLIPGAGRVLNLFGLSIFPNDVIDFFKAIIDRAIHSRKTNEKKTVDFLQLIINAAEEEDEDDDDGDAPNTHVRHFLPEGSNIKTKIRREPLTNQELMSQALAFFVAGYETTTSALCFTSYLLATNPTQQNRLIEEIDRLAPTADDVTYDSLKGFTFLDNVINESLRLYPPGSSIDRVCTKTTTINGRVFPAGVTIGLAIWSVHHNAKHWPDPEKFDPDRFTKENQAKRHPFAWLPFGGGPRICLGLRFALLEMRVALVRILQEFRLEVAPETEIPPTLGKMGFLTPPNGIILRAVSRSK